MFLQTGTPIGVAVVAAVNIRIRKLTFVGCMHVLRFPVEYVASSDNHNGREVDAV